MKIKVVAVYSPWAGQYLEESVALPAKLFSEAKRKLEENGFLERNPFAIVELDDERVVLAWLEEEGVVYVGNVSDIAAL